MAGRSIHRQVRKHGPFKVRLIPGTKARLAPFPGSNLADKLLAVLLVASGQSVSAFAGLLLLFQVKLARRAQRDPEWQTEREDFNASIAVAGGRQWLRVSLRKSRKQTYHRSATKTERLSLNARTLRHIERVTGIPRNAMGKAVEAAIEPALRALTEIQSALAHVETARPDVYFPMRLKVTISPPKDHDAA